MRNQRLQATKTVFNPQTSLSLATSIRNAKPMSVIEYSTQKLNIQLYVSKYAVTSQAAWLRALKSLDILMRAVVMIVVSIAETNRESHSLSRSVECNKQ